MNKPTESKTPVVLFPKDKNNNRGKDDPAKHIAILGALAKALTKARGKVYNG
jgi:hypothetical protein